MRSAKLKSKISKLSNRISLLEYQLRDIRHLLKGKGMEIYNSLNPETMVTPKKNQEEGEQEVQIVIQRAELVVI